MCSRKNLQLFFKFLLFFKCLAFVLLMALGVIFVTDKDLERAYGRRIVDNGGGLLTLVALIPMSQFIGMNGSANHNTFLLSTHAVFETVLFSSQFIIANEVIATSQPEFDAATRLNCMRNTPAEPSDDCKTYLKSDRYAGLHLVWAYNYDTATAGNSDYYSKIDGFQKNGDCCGFGPPLNCAPDSRKPPEDRFLEQVQPEFKKKRQVCGNVDLWYPASGSGSYTCSQVVDPNGVPLVVGGCKFEMPLGSCKDYDPEPGTAGCANVIEDTMNFTLLLEGAVILFFCVVPALSVLSSCCLCWKRKFTDVIPAHMERDPPDPYYTDWEKQAKKRAAGEPLPVFIRPIGSDLEMFDFQANPKADVDEEEGK
mmetsp:Transcript_62548/g.141340  ORF Transcript_62548/g.141340 Transcript_62548/m.141340 type:complete len:367 (+) Transcript_62548:158-1258(+)|eukprot:CAMPEP_0172607172 /NCGR_PEP_ID=MMETSP1068-20121228/27388_1 /TAXON_ID=35684 /ORGANISM="Pseudopedinella elastica, Strain CCMP716" /LENGTH=366 /DNA_ID=CAMNT_0013410109 /DNA_START=68 /DNA_END=1168 /DNA_ORIENTATION=+